MRDTLPNEDHVAKAALARRWLESGRAAAQRAGGGGAALVVLTVFYAVAAPRFFTPSNLTNVLEQTVVLGIMALGETMVIISGNIDVSVGSILALSTMVMGDLAKNYQTGPVIAILAGVGVGIATGIVNGVLVAKVRMNPLITTLATYSVLRGIAVVYTNGQPIYPLPDSFNQVGVAQFQGVPLNIAYVLAAILVVDVLLRQTRFGRHVYAIGANKEAAATVGIRVDRVTIACYVASGATAAFAGAILAGQLASASAGFGDPFLLTVIAAAVLGGASLFGGHGSSVGSYVGVLVIILIGNGLDIMLIPVAWQQVVTGAVLAGAVFIDTRRSPRRG